jgi:predicted anti-sigma-YlaC factor YlaD
MRCRDAKKRLTAQRDMQPAAGETSQVQEHLRQCSNCFTFEKRQQRLDGMLQATSPQPFPNVPTERIMRAVERQQRISQQLTHMQATQHARFARISKAGLAIAALVVLLTAGLTIGGIVLFIVQPDILLNLLDTSGGIADVGVALALDIQAGLALVSQQNWLLSVAALAFVVMSGIWLRLMRAPKVV